MVAALPEAQSLGSSASQGIESSDCVSQPLEAAMSCHSGCHYKLKADCWQDMRASVVMAEVSQVSPEPVSVHRFSAFQRDQTIDLQCSGLDHLRRAPQAEMPEPDMRLAGPRPRPRPRVCVCVCVAAWT